MVVAVRLWKSDGGMRIYSGLATGGVDRIHHIGTDFLSASKSDCPCALVPSVKMEWNYSFDLSLCPCHVCLLALSVNPLLCVCSTVFKC